MIKIYLSTTSDMYKIGTVIFLKSRIILLKKFKLHIPCSSPGEMVLESRAGNIGRATDQEPWKDGGEGGQELRVQ